VGLLQYESANGLAVGVLGAGAEHWRQSGLGPHFHDVEVWLRYVSRKVAAMRQDFPNSMPRHEQLMRLSAGKTPGRKHQKRKGVRASERAKTQQKNRNAVRLREYRVFAEMVRAYWRGERETYPIA
jgi:hypothetical protein